MMRKRIWLAAGLTAVFALALLGAAGATGLQEKEKPADDKPKEEPPPPTLVKVDISEEVDGRVYTAHNVHYRTALLLWHAGLDFKSERKTKWDKQLEKHKPRKSGDPDFVVKGTSKATLLRRPTWYDEAVAYVYGGEALITIEDAQGKVVGKYRLTMERSDRNRDKAMAKVLERLGAYAASAVVKCKAIRDRIPEKKREGLQKLLDQVQKEVTEYGGTMEDLTPKESPRSQGRK